MQAQQKRHIRRGHEYNCLFPKSIQRDTVIKVGGKAQLHHTLNLIKHLAWETRQDTQLLAEMFRGENLEETCRKIWEFVYHHIQYCRDKAGIEQVRRPSRTWADRRKGVDCDCYTVFISSILINLNIPHRIRITKYGGKPHFQHVYPIVPRQRKMESKDDLIVIDCVANHFNYEVPFSEHKDFDMNNHKVIGEINGLTYSTIGGVDLVDLFPEGLGFFSLKQPRIPIRKIVTCDKETNKENITPTRLTIRQVPKQNKTIPLFYSTVETRDTSNKKAPAGLPEVSSEKVKLAGSIATEWWTKVLIAMGVGYGTYKLFEIRN